MSLDYRLSIKSNKLLSSLIETYLKNNKILFTIDESGKAIHFDVFNILGFVISFILRDNAYFNYLISKDQCIEKEWNSSSNISFRLNKDFDNLQSRINMLEIVIFILDITNEDLILLFNSDVLILERQHGKIVINKDCGFWNSKELEDRINRDSRRS